MQRLCRIYSVYVHPFQVLQLRMRFHCVARLAFPEHLGFSEEERNRLQETESTP